MNGGSIMGCINITLE